MDTGSFESVVGKLLSAVTSERATAEEQLRSLLQREYPQTVLRLSGLVNNVAHADVVRQSAAMVFKNAIYGKDPDAEARGQKWMNIPQDIRGTAKQNIFEALRTDNALVGRVVAQCVANIALVELVQGECQDLIPSLAHGSMNQENGTVTRKSCLEAIGYICEDVRTEAVKEFSICILFTVVTAMRKEEPSSEIRYTATLAFFNSIDFFKANFEDEKDRDAIMRVVCDAAQAEDTRLRIGALQCIIKIMQYYYEFMLTYKHTLATIAFHAIGGEIQHASAEAVIETIPEVVLQGIEFWSTVGEIEISLKMEKAEARDEGRDLQIKFHSFTLDYLPFVVPRLLQLLTQQPDMDEADDWVPSKAASVCLVLIAQCVGNRALDHVLPFVEKHSNSADWRYQDAACVAFGSVLEGPEPEYLKSIVTGGAVYDVILTMMADANRNIAVRDSAAWCVQRMCQLVREAVLLPARFENTVNTLRQNLSSPPRVAVNVCWTLSTLARASYEAAQGQDNGIPKNSALSGGFEALIEELFTAAFRADSEQNHLRTAAFGALGEFLSCSPQDTHLSVWKCTDRILSHLELILKEEPHLSAEQRHQYGDYCQHFLALLQTIIRRLGSEQLMQVRQRILAVCHDALGVHLLKRSLQAEPEAFMCLSAMLERSGDSFLPCLEHFKPHIIDALKAHSDHSLLNSALTLIGEMCRAFEERIMSLVSELFMSILDVISHMSDPSGLVKPKAVQTLGDMASSLTTQHFQHYALESFECLMTIAVPRDHDVWLDLLESGRDSGCMSDARAVIQYYSQFIVSLIRHVPKETSSVPDSIILSSACLIGKFCGIFGGEVLPLLDGEDFHALLLKGRKSNNDKTKNLSRWAWKELKKLRNEQGRLIGH